jgi:hypothetical protein
MVQFTEISLGIGTYYTEIVGIGIVPITFGIDTLQIVGMGMWSRIFNSFLRTENGMSVDQL